MDCKYNIDGLILSKDEFFKYIKKRPLQETADILNINVTPSAPFVTKTSSWVKLALKMAMREAVKEGATKIAWTSGQQQIDRFDLSQQIKSLSLIKSRGAAEGYYNLIAEDNSGDEIRGYDGSGKQVDRAELEATVGVEMADKLIKGAEANKDKVWGKERNNPQFYTLSGLDLKIGGEGMKGFYGDPETGNIGIVGNVAKALIRELTGNEGNIMETEIVTLRGATKFGTETSIQHSIEITLDIAKRLDGGISLFSKMTDDVESMTKYPIPAGFTIVPKEEEWVSIADQDGREGYQMSKEDALKQIKDKFPVGTPEMSDPTALDLFRNFYKFSLSQIGTILKWNDPNGEYQDWIESETYDVQSNNLTRDYEQARDLLKSRINDWLNSNADNELTGLYIPNDGPGESTKYIDIMEDQFDIMINELIDAGEIETIDPDTKEPCVKYDYSN